MINIGISKLGMLTISAWQKTLDPFLDKPNIILLDFNDQQNRPLDYLIFDGGEDITPLFYGEPRSNRTNTNINRDALEWYLAMRYLHNTQTKYVGICRGHQFLNVFMKGTLYQDLQSIGLGHTGEHKAKPIKSKISTYVSNRPFLVNSMHHQAVKDIGFGLVPTLIEPDSQIIEGLESIQEDSIPEYMKNKIRTVQCHPEMGGFKQAPALISYLFRLQEIPNAG